ncbi:MAG: hypothetical protein GF401_06510 [Chitinivibrionales bacterium]|nr:hypothetical protein [Chitinivibrionales bacterium]
MADRELSQNEVSNLIDHLLKSKDPAVVGLRKILKTKKEEGNQFPLREVAFDSFYVEGKSKPVFEENEKRIIELEKQIGVLKAEIGKTKKNAENAVKVAFNKGLTEGKEEGEIVGEKRAQEAYEATLEEIEKNVSEIFTNLEKSQKEIYGNAQHVLLKFTFELAKKVIQTELTLNEDIVLGVVKKALSYIADKETLTVRVAKDDLETVTGKKDFWMPISERVADIEIIPDDHVDKGGCIIESNSGIADGRLGIQFDELTGLVERVWESIYNSPDQVSPAGDTPNNNQSTE